MGPPPEGMDQRLGCGGSARAPVTASPPGRLRRPAPLRAAAHRPAPAARVSLPGAPTRQMPTGATWPASGRLSAGAPASGARQLIRSVRPRTSSISAAPAARAGAGPGVVGSSSTAPSSSAVSSGGPWRSRPGVRRLPLGDGRGRAEPGRDVVAEAPGVRRDPRPVLRQASYACTARNAANHSSRLPAVSLLRARQAGASTRRRPGEQVAGGGSASRSTTAAGRAGDARGRGRGAARDSPAAGGAPRRPPGWWRCPWSASRRCRTTGRAGARRGGAAPWVGRKPTSPGRTRVPGSTRRYRCRGRPRLAEGDGGGQGRSTSRRRAARGRRVGRGAVMRVRPAML